MSTAPKRKVCRLARNGKAPGRPKPVEQCVSPEANRIRIASLLMVSMLSDRPPGAPLNFHCVSFAALAGALVLSGGVATSA